MVVHVLFFGHYRDYVEGGACALELREGATIADAAARLADSDPRLMDLLARTRAAVGTAFVPADTVLHEGDELAFLPPMSGG